MTLREIRNRMRALVQQGNACLPDFDSSEQSKVREARDKHAAAMAEFDLLERQGVAMQVVERQAREEAKRAEDAQFGELIDGAPMGSYIRALGGAPLTGAALELNAELGAHSQRGGIVVPWGVLHRAATGTAQIDAADNQRPIIGRVFAPSLIDFFGVTMQSVPTGTTELPIITGKGSVVEQLAENAAPGADPAAAPFDALSLKPKRLTGEMEVTAEALAQVAGLEQALAADTLSEINDSISAALLNGDGTGANVHGFFSRVSEPANPDAEAVLADYMGIAAAGVDGVHALSESDISILLGVNGFKHAAAKHLTNVDNVSALRYLRDQGATVLTSAKVPVGGGSGQAAAKAKRQALIVRRGQRENQSFAATWGAGPEMIRDPFSKADAGTLKVVWHLLWDAYTAVRAGEWQRLLLQVKA